MYMTSKGYGESMIPPKLPTFRSPYRYATGLLRETDILLAYIDMENMLGSCIWYTLCGWIGANPWVLVNQVILKGWTVCFHDLWRICTYDMKYSIYIYVYIYIYIFIYIYMRHMTIWHMTRHIQPGSYSYERKSTGRSRIGNPPSSVHLVCSQSFW